MKKFLFLMFPLAFFIGFAPCLFVYEDVTYVSSVPDSMNEKVNTVKNCDEDYEPKFNPVELLKMNKLDIVDNAVKMINENIYNI